jgi:hypothetical protein
LPLSFRQKYNVDLYEDFRLLDPQGRKFNYDASIVGLQALNKVAAKIEESQIGKNLSHIRFVACMVEGRHRQDDERDPCAVSSERETELKIPVVKQDPDRSPFSAQGIFTPLQIEAAIDQFLSK